MEVKGQCQTLPHLGVNGVRLNAGKLATFDTLCLKGALDALQKARAYNTAAAVDYHDTLCTVTLAKHADLTLCALAEDELRGTVECEIIHW